VHVRLTRLLGYGTVAALLLLGSPASAGSKLVQARLSLVSSQPAVARGAHFAHRERVRVSFRAGGDASVRVVRTTATGTFVAQAPAGFAYSPCGAPLVVDADGARGDHAVLSVPQRECP
jgi:hypothetical protein